VARDPLYRKLYQSLLSDIQSSRHAAGGRLPTEAQLADQYRVSKTTVRKALEMLASQGLVERWPKRGTFVSQDLGGRVARDTSGFSLDMDRDRTRLGVQTVLLESTQPGPRVAAALGLGAGAIANHVRRLRTVSGKPVMCIDHYIPQPPLPEALEASKDWLFFRAYLVQEHGILPIRYELAARAIGASDVVSSILDVPIGEPVFFVRKLLFTSDDKPCEYLESWVRTDRWQYRTNVSLGPEPGARGGQWYLLE